MLFASKALIFYRFQNTGHKVLEYVKFHS